MQQGRDCGDTRLKCENVGDNTEYKKMNKIHIVSILSLLFIIPVIACFSVTRTIPRDKEKEALIQQHINDNYTCKIRFHIEPNKTEYFPYEPVHLKISLKNIDQEKYFILYKDSLLPGDIGRRTFLYWSEEGGIMQPFESLIGRSSNMGGSTYLIPQGQQTATEPLLLNRDEICPFYEPGIYYLKTQYNICVKGGEVYIDSNETSFTVVIPDKINEDAMLELMQNQELLRVMMHWNLIPRHPWKPHYDIIKPEIEKKIIDFLDQYPESIYAKYLAVNYLRFYIQTVIMEKVLAFQPYVNIIKDISPEFPIADEAYNSLTYYYMTKGRKEKSKEDLQKALEYVNKAEQYFPDTKFLGQNIPGNYTAIEESIMRSIDKIE